MRRVCLVLMVFVVASVSYGCIWPEDTPVPSATPTPIPAAGSTSLEQVMADFGVYDNPASPGDIAVSRATLDFAADALEIRDMDLFRDTLSLDYKRDFASAGFASSGTAVLAGALRDARLAKADENAIVYRTTVDGLTFEIILIPEDGVWKIDAL